MHGLCLHSLGAPASHSRAAGSNGVHRSAHEATHTYIVRRRKLHRVAQIHMRCYTTHAHTQTYHDAVHTRALPRDKSGAARAST